MMCIPENNNFMEHTIHATDANTIPAIAPPVFILMKHE